MTDKTVTQVINELVELRTIRPEWWIERQARLLTQRLEEMPVGHSVLVSDATALDLKRQLFDQINGVKNNTGMGTLVLYDKLSGPIGFKVVSPKNSTSRKWEAHLPSGGVNIPIQYNDEASLISDIVSRFNSLKQLNAMQQSK